MPSISSPQPCFLLAAHAAVCIRLKHLTEQLFPDKVAERRAEMQQAAAQRTQGGRPGEGRIRVVAARAVRL